MSEIRTIAVGNALNNRNFWLTVGFGLLGLLFFSIVFIPAGHEGVKFNVISGKISERTLQQGWQLRLPFVTKVIVYDCRR